MPSSDAIVHKAALEHVFTTAPEQALPSTHAQVSAASPSAESTQTDDAIAACWPIPEVSSAALHAITSCPLLSDAPHNAAVQGAHDTAEDASSHNEQSTNVEGSWERFSASALTWQQPDTPQSPCAKRLPIASQQVQSASPTKARKQAPHLVPSASGVPMVMPCLERLSLSCVDADIKRGGLPKEALRQLSALTALTQLSLAGRTVDAYTLRILRVSLTRLASLDLRHSVVAKCVIADCAWTARTLLS